MTIRYVSEGDVVEYTNSGSAISAGDPVDLGAGVIGVALEDIAATTGVGSVGIAGVFELPAVTGAAITLGEQVLWDSSASKVDDSAATPATGDFLCGMAMETVASAAAGSYVKVKINQPGASVT